MKRIQNKADDPSADDMEQFAIKLKDCEQVIKGIAYGVMKTIAIMPALMADDDEAS